MRKKKPTDSTMRNVKAAKKREAALKREIKLMWDHIFNIRSLYNDSTRLFATRIGQLEKWQRDVIGGGDFRKIKKGITK